MSKLNVNQLEPQSDSKIDVIGDLESTNITATNNVNAQTFVGGGEGLEGVEGLAPRHRINDSKQVLKNEYLDAISTAVESDADYLGIVADIFRNTSNVSNSSNLTTNTGSLTSYNGVSCSQEVLTYGAEINGAVSPSTFVGSFDITSPSTSTNYTATSNPIVSMMYSPDGTNLWVFLKGTSGQNYFISAVVAFPLSQAFDGFSADTNSPTFMVEHEADSDTQFGYSGTSDRPFTIHYDDELGVVRLQGINDNVSPSTFVFVEYAVSGQLITGTNTIKDGLDPAQLVTRPFASVENGVYNSDGTKFLYVTMETAGPFVINVTSFDVSTAFSTNDTDYTQTATQTYSHSASSSFDDHRPIVRMSQDGSRLNFYNLVDANGAYLYTFQANLSSFQPVASPTIIEDSSSSDSLGFLYTLDAIINYDGTRLMGMNGTWNSPSEFAQSAEIDIVRFGDIQTPGTFERSIDLSDAFDEAPKNVILTKRDNSSDSNVSISVEISDGTNSVTVSSEDTVVDCSSLTSTSLTLTWSLTASSVTGTVPELEFYALNFR